MALEAKKVSFCYGREPVVRDFSLCLKPGTLTMLLGPNGSGKTTALQLLAGYRKPCSGEILLNGRSMALVSGGERAGLISVAPQSSLPALDFSVREIIGMGRSGRASFLRTPEASVEAEAVMESLEILHLANRPCSMLSGGELQRTVIGATLFSRAKYLLLDEPTSALDPAHALLVMDLLKERSRRSGILVLTHDLNLAMRYADRVILLKSGRIAADGGAGSALTPENIRTVFSCGAEAVVSPQGKKFLVLTRA